jgi:serine/threonine-protein kinase
MSDPVTRLNEALEGRYAIERELGEGGMATVYLARDLRHNRNVALKVLKPELAAVVGADRFLAEIETTANLQHPHILPLFDSGEADSFLFYVMPFVEGETLRDRINRDKQLPVDEAVRIATAVANALQHAHDRGVIHRDIKPANILMQDGEPLVADFGIALAVGAAGGSRLTETGLSVGTPYYMSPEQATGDQVVGPASDTYSLACVLYEMLVGDPPYVGSTAQAVLGKIIQGEPVSATKIRRSIPANVDAAIRKALEKLPADRFTGAQDFAKAMADPSFRHGGDHAASAGEDVRRWRHIAMGTSGVAAVAIGVAIWGLLPEPEAPLPVTKQVIAPIAQGMARPLGAFSAIAPDGSSLVYALPEGAGDTWNLWLKARDATEATMLPGTEGAQNIVYSPDSRSIAFASRSVLKVRPVGDGSTITLAEGLNPAPNSMVAIGWMDDGTILFEQPTSTLMRIPASGGTADTIVSYPEMGYPHVGWVHPLPGSRGALVTICPTNSCADAAELAVLDLDADTTRTLVDGVVRGWYTPTGHVVYVRMDGAVFAAPFDLTAMEMTGPGVPLFDGVIVNLSAPEMAMTWEGTVLYATSEVVDEGSIPVWVNRSGQIDVIDASIEPAILTTLALSPSDDRLALTQSPLGATNVNDQQLWVKELPDGPETRLTTDEGYTRRPAWSPDGRTIAYTTTDGGVAHVRSVLADGSSGGAFEVLLDGELGPVFESFYVPDGSGVLFRRNDEETLGDIGLLDLSTGSITEDVLATPFAEISVSLSPDGAWIAYTSSSSGPQGEVFVRPYPSLEGRTQVSAGGGFSGVWGHSGREIFYLGGDNAVWSAAYRVDDGSFVVEERTRLFDASSFYCNTGNWRCFDVASDDQRFVTIQPIAQSSATLEFVWVQNFWEELRTRTGN